MQLVQTQQGEKHEPPSAISLATENGKQTPIVKLGMEHSIMFCDTITDTTTHIPYTQEERERDVANVQDVKVTTAVHALIAGT